MITRGRALSRLALALTVLQVLTSSAAAQWSAGSDSVSTLSDIAAESLWSSVGRLALALLVVVVLIWATLWIAKRVMSGRFMGKNESPVRILERCHLAPKRSIDVVSVGNRVLVLGVTERSIGLLTELKPGDIPTAESFANTLKQKQQSPESRYRDALSQARQKLNDLFRSARIPERDAVSHT